LLAPIQKDLLKFADELEKTQQQSPLVTKYKGMFVGNYDMIKCREITDKADQLVLEQIGLGEFWQTVLLADCMMSKSTDASDAVIKEWPFPL